MLQESETKTNYGDYKVYSFQKLVLRNTNNTNKF
jgi:hypothetical protein